MQTEVVRRAKWTQGIIISMTLTAFSIGVLLVLIAVAQVTLRGDLVLGAFSSFGGVATVFGTLLYNPMKRAQESMGDLAQMQVAFLSFNSKVTMWIEYVRAKTKEPGFMPSVVKDMTSDIEEGAKDAILQIEKYCKGKNEQNPVDDKKVS